VLFFDTKDRKHEFLTAATELSCLTTVFKKHMIDLVAMEACGASGWIKTWRQPWTEND
jgi:hypothetical protein